MSITQETPLLEVATRVSEALEAAGIVATLAGGGAVSVYTENRYESADLDFVTTALRDELAPVLEPLGFLPTGTLRLSLFEHPESRWYLEFPPAPLAFGGHYVDVADCATLTTTQGKLRIISPTHSVMDRLSSAVLWGDVQSLEQAVLVASHRPNEIEWKSLAGWAASEGIESAPELAEFYRALGRPRPHEPA